MLIVIQSVQTPECIILEKDNLNLNCNFTGYIDKTDYDLMRINKNRKSLVLFGVKNKNEYHECAEIVLKITFSISDKATF